MILCCHRIHGISQRGSKRTYVGLGPLESQTAAADKLEKGCVLDKRAYRVIRQASGLARCASLLDDVIQDLVKQVQIAPSLADIYALESGVFQ